MSNEKLTAGSVVMMSASSGMNGYGNPQCVSSVCEPLGTISLYGHNQNYKLYDVQNVISVPLSSEDIETLKNGIESVRGLIDGSSGVSGLHLNGDVADWGSLQQGGHFESWLLAFSDAESVINKQAEESK